jgi:hypothetical protein
VVEVNPESMKAGFNDQARAFANAIAKINTKKLFLQAVKDTSDLALDLNRSQMYDEGIDAKGKQIGQYSETTVRIKQKKGQPTEFMTLLDTGSFYKKMFVNARSIPILIDSRDPKTPILEETYSPNILGLTREHTKLYQEAVTLEYKKLVHQTIEEKTKILH